MARLYIDSIENILRTYVLDEYGGWTIDNSRQRLNRFCMAERISCDFENNVIQTNNGYGTHFLLILILWKTQLDRLFLTSTDHANAVFV